MNFEFYLFIYLKYIYFFIKNKNKLIYYLNKINKFI